jgi:predicted RNA methylase
MAQPLLYKNCTPSKKHKCRIHLKTDRKSVTYRPKIELLQGAEPMWYDKSMKNNTKSSITLPAAELAVVEMLQKKLKIKKKVEVVRMGLKLLQESTDRETLREEFRRAAEAVAPDMEEILRDFSHLDSENLD